MSEQQQLLLATVEPAVELVDAGVGAVGVRAGSEVVRRGRFAALLGAAVGGWAPARLDVSARKSDKRASR
jgi:hypothetical protein